MSSTMHTQQFFIIITIHTAILGILSLQSKNGRIFLPSVMGNVINVYEMKPLVIPCLVATSQVNVTLWKGDCNRERVSPNAVHYVRTRGFVIPHSTKNFSGRFCCKGEFNERRREKHFRLIFYEQTSRAPVVHINEPYEVYILVNSSLTLECTIVIERGTRIIEEKWTYPVADTDRVHTTPHYEIDADDDSEKYLAKLTLTSAQKEDSGSYKCNFTDHSDKWNFKEVNVHVRDPEKPYFTESNTTSEERMETLGEKVELDCSDVKGFPKPKVKWYRDGVSLDDTNATDIRFDDDNDKLVIDRLHQNDSGIYQCWAENQYGTDSRNITLLVANDVLPFISAIPESPTDGTRVILLIVVAVGFLTALIVGFVFGRKFYQNKKRLKELELFDLKVFQEGQMSLFSPDLSIQDQPELLPYDPAWEFPIEKLKFGKTLGKGAFGRVVKAEAIGLRDDETSTTVAVKTLKETTDVEQRKALVSELKILIHLGQHVNIVNLVGAVTKNITKGELMVIVEYCPHGSLSEYLLKHKHKFIPETISCGGYGNHYKKISSFRDENMVNGDVSGLPYVPSCRRPLCSTGSSVQNPGYELFSALVSPHPSVSSARGSNGHGDSNDHHLTTADLICFSFQCATGMEYLSSRKLIHRDLAARNVLLGEGRIVKICDFGLAKDVYKYSNYVRKGDGPLPIKWMAIESIIDNVFTTKSDVWSYGVLLWEMFSLGRSPYPGEQVNFDFCRRLEEGHRMSKPYYAPDVIYQLMKSCWSKDPADRPSFAYLAAAFGDLLKPEEKQRFIDLNRPYLQTKRNYPYYRTLDETQNEEQSPVLVDGTNSYVLSSKDRNDDDLFSGRIVEDGDQKLPAKMNSVIQSWCSESVTNLLKAPSIGKTDVLLSYSTVFSDMDRKSLCETTDESVFSNSPKEPNSIFRDSQKIPDSDPAASTQNNDDDLPSGRNVEDGDQTLAAEMNSVIQSRCDESDTNRLKVPSIGNTDVPSCSTVFSDIDIKYLSETTDESVFSNSLKEPSSFSRDSQNIHDSDSADSIQNRKPYTYISLKRLS